MVLIKEVKEHSRHVRTHFLHTLSYASAEASSRFTGRVVVGAVAVALMVVCLWGGLHYYYAEPKIITSERDGSNTSKEQVYFSSPVPSPMYIFLFTRVFFILLLVFIMGSMIWSCIVSKNGTILVKRKKEAK